MPLINHKRQRQLYEAACRDRNPNQYFEDVGAALQSGELKADDFSLRQLFENFVEHGRELVESFRPGPSGGVQLLEAGDTVNTAAFSNITGQIAFSKILEGFNSEDFVFSKLVPDIQTMFDGEKIPGIGEMGDNAAVRPEGDAYATVGVTEDWIETPQTKDRGFIVPVTKEAIFFDRTGILNKRCSDVGYWLGVNKEKRLIDCVIDGNTTAHRYKWRGTVYATYQTTTPWDNVTATNALVDYTDIDNAEQTLATILDPNTGEPVLSSPKHLVVCRNRLAVARNIVMPQNIEVAPAGYATSGNVAKVTAPNYAKTYQIVTSALLQTRMTAASIAAGTWLLGDIGRAFAYMKNWDMAVEQRGQDSDVAFERNIIVRFKASERGAAATLEPRVMTKCTEA